MEGLPAAGMIEQYGIAFLGWVCFFWLAIKHLALHEEFRAKLLAQQKECEALLRAITEEYHAAQIESTKVFSKLEEKLKK